MRRCYQGAGRDTRSWAIAYQHNILGYITSHPGDRVPSLGVYEFGFRQWATPKTSDLIAPVVRICLKPRIELFLVSELRTLLCLPLFRPVSVQVAHTVSCGPIAVVLYRRFLFCYVGRGPRRLLETVRPSESSTPSWTHITTIVLYIYTHGRP